DSSVSSRLALVGLDWDAVAAADLLLLLQQYLKNSAADSSSSSSSSSSEEPHVKKVEIYLSEFGKERIEVEKIKGPAVDWKAAERPRKKRSKAAAAATAAAAAAAADEGSSSSSSDEEMQPSAEQEKALQEVLRKYQVERSRYYYAICYFDSVETAQRIYDELDGCELNFALNGLDIRFVPDELELPAANLTAAATREDLAAATAAAAAAERLAAAANGRSSSSNALRHSKVELTWDESPKDRVKFLRKKFTSKELDEQDLDAFLGSSEDSEEDTELQQQQQQQQQQQKGWKKITEENLESFRKELLGDLIRVTKDKREKGKKKKTAAVTEWKAL
ncbi:hypothetical protein, conserved, partial [Eimeria tenella]